MPPPAQPAPPRLLDVDGGVVLVVGFVALALELSPTPTPARGRLHSARGGGLHHITNGGERPSGAWFPSRLQVLDPLQLNGAGARLPLDVRPVDSKSPRLVLVELLARIQQGQLVEDVAESVRLWLRVLRRSALEARADAHARGALERGGADGRAARRVVWVKPEGRAEVA